MTTAPATGVIVRSTMQTDARALAEQLAQAQPGQVISYAVLTALIGRDVQREAYTALSRARQMVQDENRMVFVTLHGQGLRRADDDTIVRTTTGQIQALHDETRRIQRRLACVKPEGLSADAAVTYRQNVALTGALAHFTAPDTQKTLREYSRQSARPLPLAATITAFSAKKEG